MGDYGIFGFNWNWLNSPPDATRGAYARKSQKKRRLNKRRRGGKKK